ncbi:Serine--pyruvate aminotransferase, mitochondrial [Folsomia candida]|uniref:Alanine--glyoxylate aminotransferase n=1 Tax=Folsomia candida TaxID=158441 RepID=A0A226F593_FOLCA|nr:Serine--pyruvate aminotransferase, mitochondrial [Folsomia candida]
MATTSAIILPCLFLIAGGQNNHDWLSWGNEAILPPHSSILEKIDTKPTLLVSGGRGNPTQPSSIAAFNLPQMAIAEDAVIKIVEDIKHGLRYLFQTNNSNTLAIVGTGSLGIETVLDNLVEPGDTVLILLNGMWADRVKEIVTRLRIPIPMMKPPGSIFTMEEVELEIRSKKPKIVYAVNGESSAGVFQKVDFIGDLCHKHGCITVLDVIHIVGIQPFFMDKWKMDVVVCNTQKGIGAPVGKAPMSFSSRAVEKMTNRTTTPHTLLNDFQSWQKYNYWRLDATRPYFTHHSVPILLMYTLREGLALLSRDGLISSWKKHAESNLYLRKRLLEEFPFLTDTVTEPKNRLVGVVMLSFPNYLNSTEIRTHLIEKHNVDVNNGFGPSVGKVIRFALLGANANFEVADKLVNVMKETFAHFNVSSSPKT